MVNITYNKDNDTLFIQIRTSYSECLKVITYDEDIDIHVGAKYFNESEQMELKDAITDVIIRKASSKLCHTATEDIAGLLLTLRTLRGLYNEDIERDTASSIISEIENTITHYKNKYKL